MGLLPEIGLSERLNKLVTGRTPNKQIDSLLYSNTSKDGMGSWKTSDMGSPKDSPMVPMANDPKAYAKTDTSKVTQKLTGANTGSGGSSLAAKASKSSKNEKSSQQAQNIALKNQQDQAKKAVGQSWNTADGYIGDAKTSLDGMNNVQSSLATTRDAMLGAYDRQFDKTKDAIAGNKTLIERNQKGSLNDLAKNVRDNIFSQSIKLGAAANGSASGAAARAIQQAAGVNRQSILTGAGDQVSAENQKEQDATDTHNLMRKQAYEWEDKQKQDLVNEFNIQKGVYDRLVNQVPDWKKADIQAMSEANLSKLLSGLNGISTQARNYRDYLNGLVTQANQGAQQIDAATININAPAELDTPQYTDQFSVPTDGTVDKNATDFFDPKITGKKRYSNDIFGNPLTFEEAMAGGDQA